MKRVLTPHSWPWRALAVATTVLALVVQVRQADAGTVQPLAPVTTSDGRLGLCDVLPGLAPTGTSWAQLAYNAGARVNRWELRWDRIEPKRNHWNFSADDPAVQDSVQAGLRVDGILIGTPGWAAAKGQRPGNGVPAGLSYGATDRRNLWAAYVGAVVSHYRGSVNTWEIWNEPDLRSFWSGSPGDYFRLVKVAYTVIKQIDPTATVLLAGMIVPDLSFVRRVLDDAHRDPSSAAHHGYFDAAAWHSYGNAQRVYTNLERLRSLLASEGFGGVPIWVTEDGFPSSNPNGELRQAAYVLQTIAYAFAAGAAEVLVYRASDDPLPKTWGLMTSAGVPRMGYVAFQVAAQYFAHSRAVSYVPGNSVEKLALYVPNRRVTLLWNHAVDDAYVTLPSSVGSADLVDWQGNTTHLVATDSQFRLVVPGAAYNQGIDPRGSVVGGPPLLLIEDNTPQNALPSKTYVSSFSGATRRLALLNDSPAPATVQVQATNRPAVHETLVVPANGLQVVDLDLFAGLGYAGSYMVSASQPVAIEAASNRVPASTTTVSTSWFVPTAHSVTLDNPGSRSLAVSVDGYSPRGKRLASDTLHLAPRGIAVWSLPASRASQSLVVHAAGPIAVTGPGAVPELDTSWYAVHPSTPHIALFNPRGTAAHVNVRYVGASTVTGQQLRLAAGHSYTLSTHKAKALVVAANHGLAVSYGGGSGVAGSAFRQPSTRTALAMTGPTTRVSLFNPSSQVAHVSYAVLSRGKTVQHTLVLSPAHVSMVAARSTKDTPRGVIVRSDVPVVAGPAS